MIRIEKTAQSAEEVKRRAPVDTVTIESLANACTQHCPLHVLHRRKSA